MAAKKPTKEQIAYGKARAGGQGAYKITAKEVKRTAKGVAKVAGLAATVVGPGKFVKAAKIAKAAKAASKAKGATKAASSNVKIVPKTSSEARAKANAMQSEKVKDAKSGYTARLYGSIASAGKAANKSLGEKTKVVKINSNPRKGK
jgi:hypothetical protein